MSIWTFVLNLSDLIIHITIKKIYIEIMPKYHSASKILFYHLPTRGRAGIKLGDAWYVSNVSIIFDCSMLYYLLFWTLLGFIIHFYIIFGTNLLTGGPAQNCCFFPISVFRRNRISNGVQTEWNLRDRDFPTERDPGDLDTTPRHQRGGHGGGGAPTPRVRTLPRGPLGAPPTYFFILYIPTYPRTIRTGAKNLIPPSQPFVSTRSHLGACSGAPPERAIITEGFYIIIASPMKCE